MPMTLLAVRQIPKFLIRDNRMFRLVWIFLFIGPTVFAQEFDWAKCQSYFDSYQDSLLLNYLTTNVGLKGRAEVEHLYFTTCINRVLSDRERQMKSVLKGYARLEDMDIQDSLKYKYLEELHLAFRDDPEDLFDESMDYLNQSIKVKKNLNARDEELGKSYTFKGNLFFKFHDKNKFYLDSTLYYYKKAKPLVKIQSRKNRLRQNIATVSINLKRFDEVEDNLLEVDKYEFNKKSWRERSVIHNTLAKYYRSTGQDGKFLAIMDTLVPYVESKGWNEDLKHVYQNNVEFYKNKEDYRKAYDFSLLRQNVKRELGKETVEDYIKLQQLEEAAENASAKQRKLARWVMLLSFCLLLGICGFYIWQKYSRLKRTTIEHELENTKMKATLNATRAEILGQQKERQLIASELHDQLASSITAAQIHLSLVENDRTQDSKALRTAQEIISEVGSQVREISHKLVSPSLKKFGLAMAIDSVLERIPVQTIQTNFDCNCHSLRLEQSKESFLYRACNELINNVLKHSDAQIMEIELLKINDTIQLMVKDNGSKALDLNFKAEGLGIVQIKNRTEVFSGQFELSRKDGWTRAQIIMPI